VLAQEQQACRSNHYSARSTQAELFRVYLARHRQPRLNHKSIVIFQRYDALQEHHIRPPRSPRKRTRLQFYFRKWPFTNFTLLVRNTFQCRKLESRLRSHRDGWLNKFVVAIDGNRAIKVAYKYQCHGGAIAREIWQSTRLTESVLDAEKRFLQMHQRKLFRSLRLQTDRWGTIDGSEASGSQTEVRDEETRSGCQNARRKGRFTSSGSRQET